MFNSEILCNSTDVLFIWYPLTTLFTFIFFSSCGNEKCSVEITPNDGKAAWTLTARNRLGEANFTFVADPRHRGKDQQNILTHVQILCLIHFTICVFAAQCTHKLCPFLCRIHVNRLDHAPRTRMPCGFRVATLWSFRTLCLKEFYFPMCIKRSPEPVSGVNTQTHMHHERTASDTYEGRFGTLFRITHLYTHMKPFTSHTH